MKKFMMMFALIFTASFLFSPTAYAADVFNSSKSHAAHQSADAQAEKKKVALAKEKEVAKEEKNAGAKASNKAAPGGY